MTTVTQKGQITLPKKVRDALGLEPGSEVEFVLAADGVRLRKKSPSPAIARWRGYLRAGAKGRRTDEIVDELRGEPLDVR